MPSIITIENLSKQYRLGVLGTGTITLDLKRWWANIRGKEDPTLKIGMENKLAEIGGDYIWALRDINLEVNQGEVLGIIGKNGAGKSTLLKILSRVTTPTTGRIKMYGRVASLLEVGTGFHPELTGKENVFLNGAILGMTKNEIKTKFDEIVDFAGIGKYIHTPVKRYSSGMYVRLAFAVAAHLDPEILIVDEVLAVGDAEFQKKAIGKMQEFGHNNGRTVLFVSHNMSAIQNLCNRTLLLNCGYIGSIGETNDVIRTYYNTIEKNTRDNSLDDLHREGVGEIRFISVGIENKKQITSGSKLELKIKLINKTDKEIKGVRIDIGIDNSMNIRIAHLSSHTLNKTISISPKSEIELKFIIESLPLVADRYGLTLFCQASGNIQDWIKGAFFFDVDNADYYKTGKLPPAGQGNILLNYNIRQL